MAEAALESVAKALTVRANATDSQITRVLASIASALLGFIVAFIGLGFFKAGGVAPRHRLTQPQKRQ